MDVDDMATMSLNKVETFQEGKTGAESGNSCVV